MFGWACFVLLPACFRVCQLLPPCLPMCISVSASFLPPLLLPPLLTTAWVSAPTCCILEKLVSSAGIVTIASTSEGKTILAALLRVVSFLLSKARRASLIPGTLLLQRRTTGNLRQNKDETFKSDYNYNASAFLLKMADLQRITMHRSRNDDVDGKHLDSRTNWLQGSSQRDSLSLGFRVSDWLPVSAASVYFHQKLRHPQKEHTVGRRQELSLYTGQDITFTPGALGHLDQSLGWRGWGALLCCRRAVHVVWSENANDDDATFIQYDHEAVSEILYECYLQCEHFKPSGQYMFVYLSVFVLSDLEPSQQYHPCIGQHPAWQRVPSHCLSSVSWPSSNWSHQKNSFSRLRVFCLYIRYHVGCQNALKEYQGVA